MTQYSKASLQAFFETGDIPTGQNYSDFIDSCVNQVDTAVQAMNGPLAPTELITPRVSATTVYGQSVSANSLYVNTLVYASAAQFTGTVSAGNFAAATGNVLAATGTFSGLVSAGSINTGIVSAASLNTTGDISAATGKITASAASISGTVSANALNITTDISAAAGTVYASAVRSTNGFIGSSGIVSAAGTTQGTAAVLTNVINRGKGVVDGATTGFAPLANRTGLVQYLLNEGASANLWPPTGGFINGLAVNTPFPLVASASYVIFHITASSYGVK